MSLRSIERELACQRQQVLIRPIAEAFCEAWAATAAGQPYDPIANANPYEPMPQLKTRIALTTLADIDLMRAVTDAGALILATGPITSYLAQCRRAHRTPDPERVILAIVHGYGETHIRSKHQKCRCIAKVPLVPLIDDA